MIGHFTDYAQFTVMVSLQLCSVYPEFSVLQPKDSSGCHVPQSKWQLLKHMMACHVAGNSGLASVLSPG